MAMRQGAGDGECLAIRGDDGASLEHAAQALNVRVGQSERLQSVRLRTLPFSR